MHSVSAAQSQVLVEERRAFLAQLEQALDGEPQQ